MVDEAHEEPYVWLPGQTYDPVRGLNRNQRAIVPGQAPRCSSCGKARFKTRDGAFLNTCLSQTCLESFLGTNRRGREANGKKPERIEPSPALAGQLEQLLARKLRNR